MKAEEKNKLHQEISKILSQRTGEAPTNVSQPFMDGDVLTFALKGEETADKLLAYHPARVQNGNTINEYFGVVTADGREVSQTQLCRRTGHGLGLEGETPDDRLKDFLALVQDKRTIKIKVSKSRVLPSTNPEWNGTRVITWEPIER